MTTITFLTSILSARGFVIEDFRCGATF